MLGSWGFAFYVKYKISIILFAILQKNYYLAYFFLYILKIPEASSRWLYNKALYTKVSGLLNREKWSLRCVAYYFLSLKSFYPLLSILLFKKVKDLAQASVSFVKLSLCHVPTNRSQKSCGCYVAWPSPIFQGEGLWALRGTTWSSVGLPFHFSFPWLGRWSRACDCVTGVELRIANSSPVGISKSKN